MGINASGVSLLSVYFVDFLFRLLPLCTDYETIMCKGASERIQRSERDGQRVLASPVYVCDALSWIPEPSFSSFSRPPLKAVNMIIYAACPIHTYTQTHTHQRTAFAIQQGGGILWQQRAIHLVPGLKLHSWKMPNADAPTKGLLKYISLYSVNGLAGEGGGRFRY